jgi:hypothetical protein
VGTSSGRPPSHLRVFERGCVALFATTCVLTNIALSGEPRRVRSLEWKDCVCRNIDVHPTNLHLLIAVVGDNGVAQVREVSADFSTAKKVDICKAEGITAAYSTDGTRVGADTLVLGKPLDMTLRVYDKSLAKNAAIVRREFRPPRFLVGAYRAVGNDLQIVVGDAERNNIQIEGLISGRVDRQVSIETGGVWFSPTAISEDFSLLAVGNHSLSKGARGFELFNLKAGERFAADGGSQLAQLRQLSFARDGSLLAVADENGSVGTWDLKTSGEPHSLALCEDPSRGRRKYVGDLRISNNRALLAADLSGKLFIWEIGSHKLYGVIDLKDYELASFGWCRNQIATLSQKKSGDGGTASPHVCRVDVWDLGVAGLK